MSLTARVRRKLGTFTPSQRRHRQVGPAHAWKQKRAIQISFLQAQGLQPTSTLVDIGCGTLRGGIPIIQYLDTSHYCGIDVRDELERDAGKELRKHRLEHKRPTLFFGGDPMDAHLGRTFDYLWAFSVLIHLDDQHLDDLLGFVRRHLAPYGQFLANVNLGTSGDGEWLGFPVVWRTLGQYVTAAQKAGLAVEDLGELGGFGYEGPGADQHMLRFRTLPSRSTD